MKKAIMIILQTGLLLSMLLGITACGVIPVEERKLPPPTKKVEGVTYSIMVAKRSMLEIKLTDMGYVDTANKMILSFDRTNGKLNHYYVNPGDQVKKGQLLADLDAGNLPDQVQKQQSDYRIALMQYEKAKTNGMDDYATRRFYLYAQLEKIQLDELMTRYDKIRLIAPTDGVILYMGDFKQGDAVKQGDMVVCMSSKREMIIKYLNSQKARSLKKGMEATITYQRVEYPSIITMMPEDIPDSMPTLKNNVLFSANGLPEDMEIGDYVSFTIILERRENVMLIPKSLVSVQDDKKYVKLMKNSLPEMVEVTVGYSDDNRVEILSGLNDGDQIITN